MRLKEAMTGLVVAAAILTATRHSAAQPTVGVYGGNPGYELIELTTGTPYATSPFIESDWGDAATLPFAAEPGLFLPPDQNPADKLPDPAAGFDAAAATGMENYAAGALGAPVPEPASVAMLVAGLAVLAAVARRRARNAF